MGLLKSATVLSLITIFLPTLLAFTDLDQSYKAFMSMFSLDVTSMLSTKLTGGDIDVVHERYKLILYAMSYITIFREFIIITINCTTIMYVCRVIETVGTMEMMFLPKNMNYIIHELIHIPPFIRKMGPLRGMWEFAPERAMNALKQRIPKGGVNIEKTGVSNYHDQEDSMVENTYNASGILNGLMQSNSCVSGTLYLEQQQAHLGGRIIFDPLKLKLFRKQPSQLSALSVSDFHCIMTFLLFGENVQLDSSPLYAMWSLFTHYKFTEYTSTASGAKQVNMFYDWLQKLFGCLEHDELIIHPLLCTYLQPLGFNVTSVVNSVRKVPFPDLLIHTLS
jgi:hypothetical protein